MTEAKNIDRLEKLLRLAKDHAATRAEAALAMERANSIAAKYKIDLADIEEASKCNGSVRRSKEWWLAEMSLAEAIKWAEGNEHQLYRVMYARGLNTEWVWDTMTHYWSKSTTIAWAQDDEDKLRYVASRWKLGRLWLKEQIYLAELRRRKRGR